MKTSAQVVVIGGGVVGASVLFHLTENGWTDVVLVERKELTAGSTWHAAGGMHTLNGDPNVAQLQQYTVQLYRKIEERSGQDCSIHLPGGITLASDRDRMDWLNMAVARGRYLGMDELEMISPKEAQELFPLLDPQYFLGAMWDPVEGHVDPTGVTNAYAICARQAGAEISRQNRVTGLEHRADGTWTVITEHGEIHAEHVVNAGGLWAREVGRMAGLELPVLAMQHHYLVTEPMQEVADHMAATGREMPMAMDFTGEIYIRQEGEGMLLGTYEQNSRAWSEHTTPWDFDMELLPPDLDRIEPELSVAFRHYPAMATAGHQDDRERAVHVHARRQPARRTGAGPTQLLDGVRCDGRSQPGWWRRPGTRQLDDRGRSRIRHLGHGRRPVRRLRDRSRTPGSKPRRTTAAGSASRSRTRSCPRAATCRPCRSTTVSSNTTQCSAPTSGSSRRCGSSGPARSPSSRSRSGVRTLSNSWVRNLSPSAYAVGLTEVSNFSKYHVTGPGAASWLQGLFTNTLPKVGRINLTAILNEHGRVIGEFSVVRLGR